VTSRSRAAFDQIRYAQLWEDADVLTQALGDCRGKALVSICSAGDNALAMLTLDPSKVVVVDLSQAQIACLKLRIGAIAALAHGEFLELTGSRPSTRRRALLDRALARTDAQTRRLWSELAAEVEAHGAGGVGKFERYFRIFRRRWCLPLVHSAPDDPRRVRVHASCRSGPRILRHAASTRCAGGCC
jgi:S-adenosylmethionine-diacylglycerol 3-amino-3-carboxypropyl transferase